MEANDTRTGAELVIDELQRQDVDYIFGLPGGAAIPMYDAIYDSPIKLILTRHEQGATHMADGYARVTGKPSVVLVTSGPGATNTITGILTAQMDSVPMVIICGQQTTWNLGLDAFQEADVSGISYPVVKHSYLVKDPKDIPRVVREAFHLAQTGRPGPVLIDIPKDISSASLVPPTNVELDLPGYSVPGEGDEKDIVKAAELLEKAKRPVLLVGHGALISGAERAILHLAEKINVPVTTTLLGKGAFPEDHPLSLGMLGMHGTAYANMAVRDCDLIMSIGSRWDDRIVGNPEKFCPEAIKIHVDIDPAEFNKTLPMDCTIHGDARLVVEALMSRVRAGSSEEWVQQTHKWKANYPLKYSTKAGLSAQKVIEECYYASEGNAIVTTDVGQHQMWAAQFYRNREPRTWLSSGGAGTMGYGFPAAIGAQLAAPHKKVVAVVGDGGFQMTLCELSTAVVNKLPLIVLIINNKYLGMVRQWQSMFYDNRLSGVDLVGNPDFVKLAESYGAIGLRIKRNGDIKKVMEKALSIDDCPVVIDAQVVKEDNVFPMIPAGASMGDMILEAPKNKMAKPIGST